MKIQDAREYAASPPWRYTIFRLIYPFSLLTPFFHNSKEQGLPREYISTLFLPPVTYVISIAWNIYPSLAFFKCLSSFPFPQGQVMTKVDHMTLISIAHCAQFSGLRLNSIAFIHTFPLPAPVSLC